MRDQRLFADIPRTYITIATVTGGIIGLLLTQAFQWDILPTFVITLGLALACVLMTVFVYRSLRRPASDGKPTGDKRGQ
jgi:predicted MFS family arabinose efflux permease